MQLNFTVDSQRLALKSNESLVERSSKYIKCGFAFNDDWTGLNKVALFLKCGETSIPIPKRIDESGICDIPEKIAFYGGQCKLSVIGCNSATLESILAGEPVNLDNVIITTNPVRLHFEETISYDTLTEDEDISSLFIDFLRQINGLAQEVNNLKSSGGFSPIANVKQLENGTEISITDYNGTTTAIIRNGSDGYTPIKGVDYYTEDEKNALVNEILNATDDTLVLNDIETGKTFEIHISNGKLTIEESTKIGREYVTLNDDVTGEKYRIFILNGKLQMKESEG